MSIEQTLMERSGSKCELCGSEENLAVFEVPPVEAHSDKCILACGTCRDQIEGQELDQNHWRCLNDSMWSPVPVVQVMAWRMLSRISPEPWAQDLLDMMYLDEELEKWARAGMPAADSVPTLDSNGAQLAAGDTVTLIKDLDVKGTGFTAKRGTAVRGISLTDNPEHIEGRVNGVRIVILTKFVKKA